MQAWTFRVLSLVACFAMFILWYILIFGEIVVRNEKENASTKLMIVVHELILERNLLSTQLNKARKDIGQFQCETTTDKTNAQGGWCKAASTEKSGKHVTDMSLIQVLSIFLKNKTVGSFGDGPGAYKREILKLGNVTLYEAYDGSPYCEETSEGRVKFLDLTIPQFGIPRYDWIISLEVAEHIPSKYESIYLNNIFRHANEGIILSWAIPGQGGLSHTNNRPLNYVIDVMRKNGFIRDEESSKYLQEFATLSWLKRNINVYRRKDPDSDKPFTVWFL